MVTAFETAENIKNNVKDKSNIWNVNTEKEYYEIKKANQYYFSTVTIILVKIYAMTYIIKQNFLMLT